MRSTRKAQAALAAAITTVAMAGTGVALAAGHTAGDTHGVIDMSSVGYSSYSVLDLGKPGHGDRFSDIDNLGLDYAAIAGGCLGGSPRFVIEMQDPADHSKTSFVTAYVGDRPQFSCAPGAGWANSGNLTQATDQRWAVENSGAYVVYNDSSIQAFADWKVTDVALIVDSGWVFGENGDQDIAVNNVTLNDHVATGEVHVK